MREKEEGTICKGEDGVAEEFATFLVRIVGMSMIGLKQWRGKRWG